ncbi:rhodanese-like domain-containing protein [Desulfocurvibacter africanus]|uniref:sulfurtransferase n=1 Tax=Desulfocurvibacter africanus TaxID=873 RepID=UPI002FDAD84E
MAKRSHLYAALIMLLLLGVHLPVALAAKQGDKAYPNGQFLLSATKLHALLEKDGVVVVDARDDKDFDGRLLPGAVRMPWTLFTQSDPTRNIGGVFVGTVRALNILAQHGISRNDMVVLYDSVDRDGGATASYVFWVLDLLGHQRMALLERGIDGWKDAGLPVTSESAKPIPERYEASWEEVRLRRLTEEQFIMSRLGDPYYQILDSRSQDEYIGKRINTALDGTPLKPGHIPGAFNVDYTLNWRGQDKAIKPYAELRRLYGELDPTKAVIAYCHSGRRSSFSYFILRLMGFEDVILYDHSWQGWGQPQLFYPAAGK